MRRPCPAPPPPPPFNPWAWVQVLQRVTNETSFTRSREDAVFILLISTWDTWKQPCLASLPRSLFTVLRLLLSSLSISLFLFSCILFSLSHPSLQRYPFTRILFTFSLNIRCCFIFFLVYLFLSFTHCRSFSFTFYRPSYLTFSPLHPRFPPSPSSPPLSSSASASSLPPSSLNCDLLKDHPGGPSAPLRTPFSIRPKKTDKWTR